MFLIILRLSFSYSKTKYFRQENIYFDFPSYGVDNGYFEYRISGKLNKTNIKIKLFPIKEFKKIRNSLAREACRKFGTAGYVFNVTSKLTGTFPIPKKEVYVPVVGNCNKNVFKVTLKFWNENSFLDFRETNIPWNFMIICVFNIVIIVLWIHNTIINYRFFIKVHLMMGFAICLNLLKLVIRTKYWSNKIVNEESSLFRFFVDSGFSAFSNSFLLTVNAIAILGYGTYRENISFYDIISMFNICLLFFGMKIIIELIDDFLIWCPLLFVSMNIIFTYFDMINNAIIAVFYMSSDFDDENSPEYKKFQLIIDFGRNFISQFAAIILVAGLTLLMDAWKVTKVTFEEVYYCLVILNDTKYFLIREALHKGNSNIEHEEKNENALVYIKDPVEDHLTAISNRINGPTD